MNYCKLVPMDVVPPSSSAPIIQANRPKLFAVRRWKTRLKLLNPLQPPDLLYPPPPPSSFQSLWSLSYTAAPSISCGFGWNLSPPSLALPPAAVNGRAPLSPIFTDILSSTCHLHLAVALVVNTQPPLLNRPKFPLIHLEIQSFISGYLYHSNLPPVSVSAIKPENPSPALILTGSAKLQGLLNLLSSNSSLERPCLLHLALKLNAPEAASPLKIPRKVLLSDRLYQLEESPSTVYQCSLTTSKSNFIPSDVKNSKYFGFFKNLVSSTYWHSRNSSSIMPFYRTYV